MTRNSRRHASGSTGWRARPPSTGGTTSCLMSGKPQRRPRQPPSLQASGGRRARRRAHEGPRLDDRAFAAGAGGSGNCVSRERQVRLAGASSAGARARRPVAWIAGRRETETLKPIDKAIERMVSESPGRNASEREVAPKDPNPGGRAVDYPAKATRADAVWLTRRRAPAGLGATAR